MPVRRVLPIAALLASAAVLAGDMPERSLRFEHNGQPFDAALTAAAAGRANGRGALLIGGGVGNDLDWSVPGVLDTAEGPMHLTISGETHEDGTAIAAALAAEGYTVLRWSTIAVDDPLAGDWPLRATPRSFGELTGQSTAALRALRTIEQVGEGPIILVGHSLGAARAVTIAAADPHIAGLVLLAPAEMLESDRTPQSVREGGVVFLDDLLAGRDIPVLALFGSLDRSRAVDADGVRALAEREPTLEVRVLDGVGHQLGPEQDRRVGPISQEALDAIAEWAAAIDTDHIRAPNHGDP